CTPHRRAVRAPGRCAERRDDRDRGRRDGRYRRGRRDVAVRRSRRRRHDVARPRPRGGALDRRRGHRERRQGRAARAGRRRPEPARGRGRPPPRQARQRCSDARRPRSREAVGAHAARRARRGRLCRLDPARRSVVRARAVVGGRGPPRRRHRRAPVARRGAAQRVRARCAAPRARRARRDCPCASTSSRRGRAMGGRRPARARDARQEALVTAAHRLVAPPAVPAWALRGALAAVLSLGVVALTPVTLWQVVGVVAALVAAVFPALRTAYVGIAVVAIGVIQQDPEPGRTALALAVVHAVHVLSAVTLLLPARTRITVRAILPVVWRFLAVQAIAQAAGLVASLPARDGASLPVVVLAGAAALAGVVALFAAGSRGRRRESGG